MKKLKTKSLTLITIKIKKKKIENIIKKNFAQILARVRRKNNFYRNEFTSLK